MIFAALISLALAPEPSAAEAAWDQRFDAHTDRERLRHARGYIADHGDAGGASRLLTAHAIAADILWRTSCPVESILGVCASFELAETPYETCDPDGRTFVIHQRHRKTEREAKEHFAAALALVDAARAEPALEEERVMRRDVIDELQANAGALELERALRAPLRLPRPLDVLVEDWKHESGLPKWEQDYLDQRARLEALAGRVAELDEGIERFVERHETGVHPAVARARAGLLAFATHSRVLEAGATAIRTHKRTPDRVARAEERCVALRSATQSIRDRAQGAYERCLSAATTAGLWLDASRWCESQLVDVFPGAGTPLLEIVGRPASVRGSMARYGVQTDPEQEPTVEIVADRWAPEADAGHDVESGRSTLPDLHGFGRRSRARRGKVRVVAWGRHDAETLAQVLGAYVGSILMCRRHARDPGAITMRIGIDAEGEVTSVSAGDATRLGVCLRDLLGSVQFPRGSSGDNPVPTTSVAEVRFAPDRRANQ